MNGTSSFEWILSRLPSERPLRVLDVGCGDCPEASALLDVGVEAELSAITSLARPELASSLEEAAARGRVARKELRGGALWQAPDPARGR